MIQAAAGTLKAHDTASHPNTISTPEGDNEYAPDQPLTPGSPSVERPRGNEPHPTMPLRPAQ